MNDRTHSRAIAPAASKASWWAEVTHNRIIALVLAMILAVPLLAAPADYNVTGLAAITLQTFALVLATTLLWRARFDLRPESIRRFLSTSANLPVLLFVALMGVSCALSPHKELSIQECLRTGSGVLLYFVAAYHFRQSKHLSLLAGTLLVLAAAVAMGGMAKYQLFAEERASAVFGNPQPLASFVMLLLPVVAALGWMDKNPTRRMVALFTGLLMMGCLMLTQGRSAAIGAFAGLAVLAYLGTRALPGQTKAKSAPAPLASRKHLLVWPVLLAVVALSFLVVVKSQNDSLGSRAITTTQLVKDGSWQERVQSYWTGSVEMIKQRPLTGWGTGLFPVYQSKFTGRGVAIPPTGQGARTSLAENAHNFYLQTAAELGLPGLLLVLATLGTFLVAGFKRVRELEAGIRRTLLMGSLAATIAFMVDAIGSPSWQYGQTSMFLWLMLGMGTSCIRPRVKGEEKAATVAAQNSPVARRIALISRPMAVGLGLVIATMLPSGIGSAQAADYGGSDTGRVVVGSAAVVGLLYFLATVSEGGVAGAGVAGSGGFIPPVAPTPTPTPTPTPVITP